jgi:ATP-dependent Clp protease adaptor protein ClpS
MNGFSPETEGETVSKIREEITEPPMYKVLLHNDDYTTMEFVVEILMRIFHKSIEDATRIMLNVHKTGLGICGIYTYEIAETKVETTHELAMERGFPLKSSMEKA